MSMDRIRIRGAGVDVRMPRENRSSERQHEQAQSRRQQQEEVADHREEKGRDNKRKSLRLALAVAAALGGHQMIKKEGLAPNPEPAAHTHVIKQPDAQKPRPAPRIADIPHMQTEAGPPQRTAHVDRVPHPQTYTYESNIQQDQNWFSSMLDADTIHDSDLARIESLMLDEQIDVSNKIRFLQRAFGSDGVYMRTLNDPRLDTQRFGTIVTIVDRVSTQMNDAFKAKRWIKGFEYLFSSSTFITLRNSAHVISDRSGFNFCNLFISRGPTGLLYADTDTHCTPQMPPDVEPAFVKGDTSDAAAALITPAIEQKLKLNLTKEQARDLPIFDPSLTIDQIAGQPIVSYSFDPKVPLINGVRQSTIHFSIAVPWTKVIRKLSGAENLPEYSKSFNDNTMFMSVPPEEGKVLYTSPDGTVVTRGASGKSGSLIALPRPNGVRVVGSLISVASQLKCGTTCRTTFSFNTPPVHEALRIGDRLIKGDPTARMSTRYRF